VRVVYVNHTGEVSGGEVSLLHTLVALRSTDVQALLVAPADGSLAAGARRAGIRVREAAFGSPRLGINPIRVAAGAGSLWRYARELGAILRDEVVDVVHANSTRAGLIASLSRRLHGKPVVWNVRDFLPLDPVGLAVRSVARFGADRVLANSEAVRADFARWQGLRAKTSVVYPGVPACMFEPPAGRPGLRDSWRIPAHALVVGYVGQIAPWKRVEDALDAFAAVADRFTAAHLVIAGEPKFRRENLEYRERLRGLAGAHGLEPRIHFVGFETEVDRVFRSLDVLLHPAAREPFGRVLVEAMAQGVPVVAVADGGIPEIVQDAQTGFLVPVGDVSAMALRLSWLLEDEGRRREIGEAGRLSACRRFSVEATVPALLGIYRELARRA
jgi:glycosyltransferase involved in cell wall biosynthesis